MQIPVVENASSGRTAVLLWLVRQKRNITVSAAAILLPQTGMKSTSLEQKNLSGAGSSDLKVDFFLRYPLATRPRVCYTIRCQGQSELMPERK